MRVIDFYNTLALPSELSDGIEVMNPYAREEVMEALSAFYTNYFNDERKRVYIVGINPGRLGAGVTGIAFTDTEGLRVCGIENNVAETRELSAEFVYRVIAAYGGAEKFYRDFFVTSFCPVGFMKDGVNFNYYDSTAFMKAVLPYIRETFKRQMSFGAKRSAVVLGRGKNYKAISDVNEEHGFFDRIVPLDHPRFVMQYRRKRIDAYIEEYLAALSDALAD